jgi:signal transduction histidine kinase
MSDPRIWIELRREDNTAALTVTDNAGGIPECIVDRIFDFQFTTKAATGGTGIGLYMSRNIIEKNMGGKLTASNVRDGARFSINLATSCPPSATTGG